MKIPAFNMPRPISWLILILPSFIFLTSLVWNEFNPSYDDQLFFILFFLFVLWVIVWSIVLALLAWQKQFYPLIFFLSGLLCLWQTIAFLLWFPLVEDIHLAATYPKYWSIINANPDARHKFTEDHWDDPMRQEIERSVIYDPTDNLPTENKIKNAKARKATLKGEYFPDESLLYTKALFGHFYLVAENRTTPI